jgi:hypothetical protein
MKRVIDILVAVLMVVGVSTVWADTNAFTAKLRGVIATDAGKIPIKETDILTAPTNNLVLVVNTTKNSFGLYEVSGTNVVQGIAETWCSALLDNRTFNGDFEYWGGPLNLANTPVGAAHPFNGGIQGTGKASPKTGAVKKVSVSCVGVWTDPYGGGLSNYPAATFKGVLTTVEPIPVPAGY